jgi:hypothetical protein
VDKLTSVYSQTCCLYLEAIVCLYKLLFFVHHSPYTMVDAPARSWLPLVALYAFWISLAQALSGQEPLKGVAEARGYNPGEGIPVSCLNRTM